MMLSSVASQTICAGRGCDRRPWWTMRVPGRRGLQICLGVVWLLDAALQYQPFMFRPFFVTLGIELSDRRQPGPRRRPGHMGKPGHAQAHRPL